MHRNATLSLDGFRASLLAGLLATGAALSCTLAEPEHCANLAGDRTCEARYGPEFQCSQCSLERDGCTIAAVSASCSPTEGLQSHCAYQSTPDDFCATLTQGAAPYCSACATLNNDSGCVTSTPPADCGGESSEGSGTAADTDTGDESTTTGSPPTCTQEDGEVSPACQSLDPLSPFCDVSGECVTCDETMAPDEACVGLDPATPICDAGTCVECVTDADCSGTTPICEGKTCQGCQAHSECPDAACKLASGACFGVADVRWVDGAKPGTECVGADALTEATAVCNFAAAKATLVDEGVILFKSFAGTYVDTMQVNPGEEFALLGVGTSPAVFDPADGPFAALSVSSAIAYLAHAELSNNAQSSGVICDDTDLSGTSSVYLTEASSVLNGRYGVESTDCRLVLDRALIHDNTLGGLNVIRGTLDAINTRITYNGVFGPMEATGGIKLQDTSIERFSYNSVVYNQSIDPSAQDTLTCAGSVSGSVRNSILLGRVDESVAAGCTSLLNISSSVVDTASLVGGTNLGAGAWDFAIFQDMTAGDLHLTDLVPLSWTTAAAWAEGDPSVDIDGDPRDAAASAAGVDEPN